MADFVAVIRRAVDGLASNTPEMRIRVYEKARGAVQRQLENMKPRPSDDMLRRQMEKLEAAIREVEAEHQEAAPREDAAPVAAAPVAVAAPVIMQPPEPEPDVVQEAAPVADVYRDEAPAQAPSYPQADYVSEEPVQVLPAADHGSARFEEQPHADVPVVEEAAEFHPEPAQPAGWHQPVEHEPLPEQYDEPAQRIEPEPQPVQPYDVAAYHSPEPALQGADQYDAAQYDDAVPQADADHVHAPEEPAAAQDYVATVERQHQTVDPFADEAEQAEAQRFRDAVAAHEQALASSQTVDEEWPSHAAEPAAVPEQVVDRDLSFDGDRPSFRSASKVAPAWPDAPSTAPVVQDAEDRQPTDRLDNDLRDEPQREAAQPAQRFDDSAAADLFSAHFSDQQYVSAEPRMPPIADFPDFGPRQQEEKAVEPTTEQVDDPLAEFLRPPVAEQPARPKPEKDASDPWNDLEELIGFDRSSAATTAAAAAASARVAETSERPRSAPEAPNELDELMAAPAARSYRVQPKRKRSIAPIILAVLGVLLLCGGGYAIWMNRDALSGIIGSAEKKISTQQASTPAATPAQSGPQTAATKPQQTSAPANQPPKAGEGDGPQKFTQRLLANGTEVDDGSGGPAANGQNQSVAQLNAAGTADAAANDAPAAEANSATATTPAAPDQPANAVAAAGDKIFLYEERVGQSSPTAVEGSVSWSLQKEAGENGRPEPAVQGRISIPGRGLTALITFKRNTDPSLPASHLVEFVFSLPPNFEGSSIDSVQRISMKQTEQDRGDPLVAVPAKITSDFHMIALNDFPDARARNLELLKSRDWMDVPLVYGNGRRALLTLQKGDDGRKAFDEATREWQAAAPQQGQ